MMKNTILFVIATIVAIASAGCQYRDIHVTTGAELNIALQAAAPGVNIILQYGTTFTLPNKIFTMTANGDKDCPITIKPEEYGSYAGPAVIGTTLNLTSSTFVKVVNVTIFGIDNSAVSNGRNVVFEGVHFSCKVGNQLSCYGASLNKASKVEFHDCVFENNEMGFYGANISSVSFDRCKFVDNNQDMMVLTTSDVSITECSYYGNKTSLPSWIFFDKCKSLNVRDNFFMCYNKVITSGVFIDHDVDVKGIRNNYFVVEKGGYAIGVNLYRVCASNQVFGGGKLCNGYLDTSC